MFKVQQFEDRDVYLGRILEYLPLGMASVIRNYSSENKIAISEIRLRNNGNIVLRSKKDSFRLKYTVTENDINSVLRVITGNSMYSFTNTINKGYITTCDNIRVGVCGSALITDGKVVNVCGISSLIFRIPHRHYGIAGEFCKLWTEKKGLSLIYSPPMGGKTSMLREFADEISSEPYNYQVAVIDTRREICAGLNTGRFDALYGYPRSEGISIAINTLSPDIIICDEIITSEDVDSIIKACGCGVSVVAAIHGTYNDIMKRVAVKTLIDSGFVTLIYGLDNSKEKHHVNVL